MNTAVFFMPILPVSVILLSVTHNTPKVPKSVYHTDRSNANDSFLSRLSDRFTDIIKV